MRGERTTILSTIYANALEDPHHVAVIDGERRITYLELYAKISANRTAANQIGGRPGNAVVVAVSRQAEFIVACLSLFAAGFWVIPIDCNTAPAQIHRIQDQTNASVLDDGVYHQLFADTISREFSPPVADGCSTGIYHLTSGSTGEPKLCVRTLDALTQEGLMFQTALSITSRDVLCGPAPLWHSYTFGAVFMAAFASGACIGCVEGFLPRSILNTVRVHKVTIICMVPAMVEVLCKIPIENPVGLPSLRVALVGTGAFTDADQHIFSRRFGVLLSCNYGSTETGSLTVGIGMGGSGVVGKQLPSIEIMLTNGEEDVTHQGKTGDVWVRSPAMMTNYFGETAGTFNENGFFAMSDLAYRDENCIFHLQGRKSSVFKIGGKTINPFEIERVLLTHPDIKECMVVKDVDGMGIERVKAYVVGSIQCQEMIRHCAHSLTKHLIPSALQTVDSLPKNKMGKLIRNAQDHQKNNGYKERENGL